MPVPDLYSSALNWKTVSWSAGLVPLDGLPTLPDLEIALHRSAGHAGPAVIALGGGAIETEAVRELLFSSDLSRPTSVPATVTIFLSAPLPDLLARCHVEPGPTQSTESTDETPVRPLLTAAEPPEDRLARRLPHYRRAHLTLDTAGIPAVEVVERIVGWLRGRVVSRS